MRLREATRADLPAIVALLADDPLGSARETVADPLPGGYVEAFEAIASDPAHVLLVAEREDRVIGCLQLTVVPGLSYVGMARAQIEGVRVVRDARNRGVGEALVRRAIEIARARGCGMIQLTSSRSRADAQRFYVRLGFEASHIGMKLML